MTSSTTPDPHAAAAGATAPATAPSGVADVVVVGAGIVGLATARELLLRRPDSRVVVLDKEDGPGRHQTGHNSGVIHAGLYYPAGSLKAQLCREGRDELIRFADEQNIPYVLNGKLVVAVDASELGRLTELKQRGAANGIRGLRELGPDELREVEPHIVGLRALHVPETGSIDYREVARAYASDIERRGGTLLFGREVTGIASRRGGGGAAAAEHVVTTRAGEQIVARRVVACAGLQSDRVARLTSRSPRIRRVVPFRGDYFVLSPEAAKLVNGHVYPVPDPAFPFLGVHVAPRIDGQVWAGPNAVPALAREGYGRLSLDLRDAVDLLGYPGFWKLASRYARLGAGEIWRDVVKSAAVREMRRYLPALEDSEVSFGPSGIRAQVLARDGTLVDDFLMERDGDVLHVLNAPSPAATASLAIGRRIADRLDGAAV